jgi:hypothetical protein
MTETNLFAEEEQQDQLETLAALIARQTRLLEEIRNLLAEQIQRTESMRKPPG